MSSDREWYWHYVEPFRDHKQRECNICHLFMVATTESEVRVMVIMHVGRCHPEEYLAATGHSPTDDHLREQAYLLREGFQ